MGSDKFIRVSVKDLQSMAFTPKELKTVLGLIDFYITITSATTKLSKKEIQWIDSLKRKCNKLLTKNGAPDGNAT